jgi:hypothetical protein
MATVALLQEALVNSLMLNGPLGTTLELRLSCHAAEHESKRGGRDEHGRDRCVDCH